MWVGKRVFDLIFSFLGLIVLLPIFGIIAAWIKWDSTGPVFFRQVRIGRDGRPFRIHKFRTMTVGAEKMGPQITVGVDKRITAPGHFLRKYKLDELPQLIDVLFGDMSFVGPRPEVPKYVELYPEEIRAIVLSMRPGITDWASLEFKDESEILGKSKNPENDYVETILPIKLKYHLRYAQNASSKQDLKLIFLTLKEIFITR